MRACYDLHISPASWDFATFLACAEVERRKRGEEHLDIVFAPGPAQGFRNAKTPPFSVAEREAMLERVCIPLTRLLPSVRSVERLGDRTCLDDAWGFERKEMGFPKLLKVLGEDGGRAFGYAGSSAKDDTLITITLRECDYFPGRNSDVAAWMVAAERLQNSGYLVIFVPDTAKADDDRMFHVAPDASLSVDARWGLYYVAALNCFVPNGPWALCLHGNLPSLCMWKTGDNHGATSDEYLTACGFPRGSQWPGAGPMERIVWSEAGDSDPDEIVAAVEEMLSLRAAA